MNVKLIAVALFYFFTGKVDAQGNISQSNEKSIKMKAKVVVEEYSKALSKGDVPMAFSYFSLRFLSSELLSSSILLVLPLRQENRNR